MPRRIQGAILRRVSDYAVLKAEIRTAGLFARQPLYYTLRIVTSCALLAGVVALLLAARSWWQVLLVSLLFGPALGQVASFTHDCGHRAVLPAGRANDVLGLLFGNLVGGLSWSWWYDKLVHVFF